MFIKSLNPYFNTSVKEIASNGILLNKIVVGKTVVNGVSVATSAGVLMDWANKANK